MRTMSLQFRTRSLSLSAPQPLPLSLPSAAATAAQRSPSPASRRAASALVLHLLINTRACMLHPRQTRVPAVSRPTGASCRCRAATSTGLIEHTTASHAQAQSQNQRLPQQCKSRTTRAEQSRWNRAGNRQSGAQGHSGKALQQQRVKGADRDGSQGERAALSARTHALTHRWRRGRSCAS